MLHAIFRVAELVVAEASADISLLFSCLGYAVFSVPDFACFGIGFVLA